MSLSCVSCPRRGRQSPRVERFLRAFLFIAAATIVVSSSVVVASNPYQVLGVPAHASDDEIKKAFKKLARTMHPDAVQGGDREAVRKKWIDLTEAYEVLADKKKREQFDNSGRRGPTEDANFLRYNLFTNNFVGEHMSGDAVDKLIDKTSTTKTLVFFWSHNFPNCIDAGMEWKKLAERLQSSSFRVGVVKCDDHVRTCQRLGFHDLPQAALFPGDKGAKWVLFREKYALPALLDFALSRLPQLDHRIMWAHPTSFLDICPNPTASVGHFAAAYFLETSKRCYKGTATAGVVAFEYLPCIDCVNELRLVVDSHKTASIRRVACDVPGVAATCHKLAPKDRDRAWTIAAPRVVCWYAMKRPFVFSDEVCISEPARQFRGKYSSAELLYWLFSAEPSAALPLVPLATVKKSTDGYVVLLTRSEDRLMSVQWEILSRRINRGATIKHAKKGYPLRAASVSCMPPARGEPPVHEVCSLGDTSKNQIVVFPYGVKAKAKPVFVDDVVATYEKMMKVLTAESDPLRLVELTNGNYETKVNKILAKGNRVFVLFNGGQWCPPCNQIRPEWNQLARLMQDSPHRKKIAVAVVDCDVQRTLCSQLRVDNYPSVGLLTKGKPKIDYHGNRMAHPMFDWVVDTLDNSLSPLGGHAVIQKHNAGATMLVCFSAGAWCPPCTQVGPIFKKTAGLLIGHTVVAINCDQDRQVCGHFNIQSYPTVALLKGGQMNYFQGDRNDPAAMAAWFNANK